jgi:carbonic anhydrase
MFDLKFCLIILSFAYQMKCETSGTWNYDTAGPDVWYAEFKTCSGQYQSPIDILTDKVVYDSKLKPIILKDGSIIDAWNITNTGYSLVFKELDDESRLTSKMIGSDFKEEFSLAQFHFHWGENNGQGSEHFIDGKKYPLEVHLVHSSKSGAFSVLGFLFQISANDNPNLEPLLTSVRKLNDVNSNHIANFSLELMLSSMETIDNYYRYIGSLTTPPCSQGIIWNMAEKKIDISARQMDNFRANAVRKNFRHPQGLFDRKVYTSIMPKNIIYLFYDYIVQLFKKIFNWA